MIGFLLSISGLEAIASSMTAGDAAGDPAPVGIRNIANKVFACSPVTDSLRSKLVAGTVGVLGAP
jgi:hypothetical protein